MNNKRKEVKKNCFGFVEMPSGRFSCSALTVLDCKNCPFYKDFDFYNKYVEPLQYKKDTV